MLVTPKTPTQLAKALSTSLPNITPKLKDLTGAGLVECLTPNALKGRIFALTAKGIEVVEIIRKMEENPPPGDID